MPLSYFILRAGKIPLRTVLIVPFVLQIFAAVGLVGYLSFRNGQRAVNEVATQFRQEVAVRVEQSLRSYLAIPHAVNQNNAAAIDLKQLNLQDLSGLEQYFWRQLQVFDTLSFVGLGFENRDNLGAERVDDGSLVLRVSTRASNYNFGTYSTNQLGQPVELLHQKANFDPRTRPWYKAAVVAKGPAWSEIYPNTAGLTAYLGASLSFSDQQGNLQGVLLTTINLSQIGTFLQSLKVGEAGQVFIIERSGLLVATSTNEKPFRTLQREFGAERVKAIDSSNALTQAAVQYLTENFSTNGNINIRQSQMLGFELNNQRQFLQILPFQDEYGLDWLIVVVVPEAEFMEQINANTRNTVLLAIAALLIAVIFGILTAQWITRPLLQVSQAARDIAEGKLDQPMRLSQFVEIETLAHSFNRMAEQLKTSFTAVKQSEAQNRAIVDALPDLLFRASGDGVYLDDPIGRNRLKALFSGDKSLAGVSIYDSLPPQQAQQRVQAIQAALQTGELQVYEHQLKIENQKIDEEVRVIKIAENEVLIMIRDITDRKQAITALHIAEANYRSIFENALEGIFQSSPDGYFTSVNPAMAKIYGYASPQEMLASINDIGSQIYVDPAKHKEFKRLLHEQGQVKDLEYQIYRKDGSIVWVEETTRVVQDEYGNILYYEGIVQNITERKQQKEILESMVERRTTELAQANAALQASETELRGLFTAMDDVIIVYNGEGRCLKVASIHPDLLLKSSEEMVGQTIHELLPKAQADLQLSSIQQVLKTRQTSTFEYSLLLNERETWFSANISPLSDQTVIMVSRDINARKQAEAAQQKQLHFLQVILDALPFPIFYKDAQGIYLGCNQAFLDFRGMRSDQIVGKSVYETAPPHLAEIYAAADQALFESRGIQTYETSVAYADGSQHDVIFYKATFLEQTGYLGGLVGAILDISDRKRAEAALQESLEQLALANQEIQLLNQRLESENLRLSAELSVARQLQQMILPKENEFDQIEDLDIAGFMEPADEVGGDYYDVLYHNGRVKIGIGDVTGHGLESGVLMIMVQTAVRTLLANNETDPQHFLSTLNQVIYDNVQRMNSNRNLSLAILDYQPGFVKLSGQHEEMLVVRTNGQVERIDTVDLGFFLGMVPDISEFIDHTEVQLFPGDGVVLYTDGITEAENDAKEYYGIDRLCHVVSQNWHHTANQIRQAIVADVRSHIGEQKVYDDITLLVLKQK